MTLVSNTPLVFVALMTNRQHSLGGLHWQTAAGDATALQPLLSSELYAELAANTPCVWEAATVQAWPEPLQQLLTETHSRTVAVQELQQAHTALPQPWPANAEWLLGQWYTEPPVKVNAAQAASRATALRLLQLVSDDADTHEIEEVFRQDASLAYQLLRIVNSLAMGGQRQITSFGQAILMMGRQPLRRWLNLLLFAARPDDARSSMLMTHVVLRARGMELLANAVGLDRVDQDQAFMTGMFSMLDALFGQPLNEILRPLKLPDDVLDALFRHQGEVGKLLQVWKAVENAEADTVAQALGSWNIEPAAFNLLLVQACEWMLRITRESPRT